jgi:glycosyltransferase involved in cell wall biosynthesis
MVLTVGRLVERKGIRYLIDAMRLLPVSLNAELVVVGGGPLKGELEEQARAHGLGDRVKFAGKVSEQELIDYYRNAAVYVQPAIVDSRGDTEMLGVVLLEAMHYGVPVVASKVGGITDVVRDGETGLLVPGKDPNELALGIQRLLNDVQLRHKVTVNAKKSLATNYKWDKILQKIVNVYSNL